MSSHPDVLNRSVTWLPTRWTDSAVSLLCLYYYLVLNAAFMS